MEGLVIFFLILIGLVLLIIEILFIPGTTIFGIFGIISIISNYLFSILWSRVNSILYDRSSILVLGVIIYSKIQNMEKSIFRKIHTTKVSKNTYDKLKIGDIGKSKSFLNRTGKENLETKYMK